MSPFAQSLAGALPAWRSLCDQRLPLWRFLGRRARSLSRLQALTAALRCESCRARQRCLRRISAGLSGPAPGCPNRGLLLR